MGGTYLTTQQEMVVTGIDSFPSHRTLLMQKCLIDCSHFSFLFFLFVLFEGSAILLTYMHGIHIVGTLMEWALMVSSFL